MPNLPGLPFEVTTNRIKIIIIIAAVFIAFVILIIYGARLIQHPVAVKLTVWGVFDDKVAFDKLLTDYLGQRSNVTINYVKKADDADTYEKILIDALAAGNGPDIFMVQNNWLPKHQDKIKALDPQLQVIEKYPFVNFRDAFPDVVMTDFTVGDTILASPLYLDTVAMFYNRDFFDQKGIAQVPATWSDFDNIVPRLREIDTSTNGIHKAAAAIGGTPASINRATDLVTVIMMQRGAGFTDPENKHATFAEPANNSTPGLDGLKYYTQFANPLSPLYTWSERFPYSVDSFSSGDTAIMFDYAHEIPIIKSKNPFLNFRVAPLPQLAGVNKINYANYWGLAVSKQSKNYDWAWDFIIKVTTGETGESAYGDATGKPPALLTLINNKLNDPKLGVFAKQALTARSWWQIDNSAVERILGSMIGSVISGELTPEIAISKAEDSVSLMMRQSQ